PMRHRKDSLFLSGTDCRAMLFAVVNGLHLGGQSYVGVAKIRWNHHVLLHSLLIGVAVNFALGQPSSFPVSGRLNSVLQQYCVGCHDNQLKRGGLDLESLSRGDVREHSDQWEHVIRKLRARQMPPIGKERPPDRTYDEIITWLASSLDRAAAKN